MSTQFKTNGKYGRRCALIISGHILGLSLIVLALSSSCYTQTDEFNEDWRWVRFTIESGLPSNNVSDIVETKKGTVWAVTSSGLAWYDGFEWRPMQESSAVFRNQPEWVVQYADDSVIAVFGGKIYIVDKQGFRLIPIHIEQRDVTVEAVYPIQSSRWMIKVDGRLFMHDGENNDKIVIPTYLLDPALLFFYSKGGGVWMNTKAGLFRWNGKQWQLKLKSQDRQYKILSLIEDNHGKAAVSIFDPLPLRGLWECRNVDEQLTFNSSEGQALITSMDIAPSGDMIAVFESGDVRIHSHAVSTSLSNSPAQLRNARFLKFVQNGNLWVGSESGLYLFKHSSHRWNYWKHPFPSLRNTVHEIYRAHDGSLLLGTTQGLEIHRSQAPTEFIDSINGKKIFGITGIAEDKDGKLWISSGSQFDGAYCRNATGWQYFGAKEGFNARRIHKIKEDLDGRLWFLGLNDANSTAPGATVYENGKFSPWGTEQGMMGRRVYAFTQTHDKAVWFGAAGGLWRWKNNTWKTFEELTTIKIFALASDRDDQVWFGSNYGSKFGYVDREDHVHLLQLGDEHFQVPIWDLVFDDAGRLWISTHGGAGLLCYQNGVWSTFNLSTGLNSLTLWPILPVENKLYIGTDGNGVSILNFEESSDPVPKIRIDPAVIDGNDAIIRVRPFTFLGALPMNDIKMRYRLDEQLWSAWTTQNDHKFSENTIGSHRIRVQAKGLFGAFDSLGQMSTFEIAAPFYQRPVFALPISALSLTVILLGVTLIVRKRKHDASLKRSEAKFRRLTEATFEGIAIHDRGIILDANPSILKIFGCEYPEFVGKSVLNFVSPTSQDAVARNMLSDSERPYEVVGLRKDGTKIILEIIGKTIPYGSGTAGVVAIHDITNRKDAEKQLLAYQKSLQSLASELSLTEERERRRMATYLHDYIGQALALCRMKLGLKGSLVSKDELDDVRKYVDQATQHTQSLTFELSPPILYELNFEDAVEWLIEQMTNEHHLPIYFYDDKSPKYLDLNARSILYNAIRELLINIVKHAEAHSAKVSLCGIDGAVSICIQDDGKGFDTSRTHNSEIKKESFGIFNVRERITRLGGQLKIESRLGQGTTVTLMMPLKQIESSTEKQQL